MMELFVSLMSGALFMAFIGAAAAAIFYYMDYRE